MRFEILSEYDRVLQHFESHLVLLRTSLIRDKSRGSVICQQHNRSLRHFQTRTIKLYCNASDRGNNFCFMCFIFPSL